MRLPGASWPLLRLQHALRWSAVVWLMWFLLISPWLSAVQVVQAHVLAWLGGLPGLLLLPVLWRGRDGRMLIFAALILLLYLGHAVLGYFQAEPLRTTVELVLVVNLLYWTGWVIERLPRLQQAAAGQGSGSATGDDRP